MAATTPNPPLNIAPQLHPYLVTPSSYLTNNPTISHLVASAAVIDPKTNRILLLQRAAHGFQPLLWELPGGRCEAHDPSVVVSAVRELWEESGLVAKSVREVVGWYEWEDKGNRWRKVCFLVDVEEGYGDVRIDPKEQESWLWASEEELRKGRCGDVELRWTSGEMRCIVLDAFQLRARDSDAVV